MTLHTDIPTRSELERLLAARDPGCVSIYLPTTPITQEAQADRIELKNLASEAARQLEAAGADRRSAADVRESLEDLVDDEDFWAMQARSLAVFASPRALRTFRLPNRLTSVVEVGDRFYVKPLLRAVSFPRAAFVLALAAGSVRVVEVTADGPSYPVGVPDMPRDLDAVRVTLAPRTQSARLAGAEPEKLRLRQFARRVDHALRGVLTGLELPLILAAAEPLDSIYRSVNSYPHLVERGIQGNPETTTDADLAAAARTVLDEVYAQEMTALHELFDLRFAHERASADLATVARAATYGAVDTLVVDIDQKVPGFVDEDTGVVQPAADDASSYGVVDEIARRVLLAGGRVVAVRADDVPSNGPVAAILRYAL